LTRNSERDHLLNRALKKAGWKVLRIWEHELTNKNRARLMRRIHRALV
jgi:G:T-mismatch repair DNA endonuclease (very short patch repair protein)